LWAEDGVCGLLHEHSGGRRRAFSEQDVALAKQIAAEEPLTLSGVAERRAPLGCSLKTLGDSLKREGFSCKRTRFSLKKAGPRRV